jgi:copper(I)-binding protein
MKRVSLIVLLMATGVASVSPAWAAPFEITDGWFRALPGKLPAGGYFTAFNGTNNEISIIGADSDGCGMLMIHQSSNKGGMSGMDMVDKVSVPANGTVRFAPGGYHLMCDSPTAKMKVGSKVAVSLKLSDGSSVTAGFVVKNAAGK